MHAIVPLEAKHMAKELDGGWQYWHQNPNIEYQLVDDGLRIRFKSPRRHAGWIRSFSGSVEETIRQQLREMSGRTK